MFCSPCTQGCNADSEGNALNMMAKLRGNQIVPGVALRVEPEVHHDCGGGAAVLVLRCSCSPCVPEPKSQ